MNDYSFLLLWGIPFLLLAIGAGYLIASRKTKAKAGKAAAREDSTEPRELTGEEQYKRRHQA